MPLFRRNRETQSREREAWDLSPEVERERFQNQLTDDQWLAETIFWFTSGLGLAGRSGVPSDWWGGEPFSSDNVATLKDLYYLRFLVDKTLTMVEELFPLYVDVYERVVKKLVMVKSDNREIDSRSFSNVDLYAIKFDFSAITGNDYFDRNHGDRLATMIHEFIHLLLYERFGLYSLGSQSPNELSPAGESSRIQEEKLAAVLHELGVYAVMPEVYHRFEKATADQSTLSGLHDYIRQTMRLMAKDNRKLKSPGSSGRSISDQRIVKYIMAYKLADHLARNGWRYSDLPKLTLKVEQIIQSELGERYREILPTLIISEREDSLSQRVLARIRDLRP